MRLPFGYRGLVWYRKAEYHTHSPVGSERVQSTLADESSPHLCLVVERRHRRTAEIDRRDLEPTEHTPLHSLDASSGWASGSA